MNMPQWKLIDGGADQNFARYTCRVNLNEIGLLPEPITVGEWRVATLTAEKETAWATAVIELKWHASKTGPRYSIVPAKVLTAATSPPTTYQVDITALAFITAEITTVEGSDAFVQLHLSLHKGV